MPNVPDPKQPIRTLLSEALHFRRGIRMYMLRLALGQDLTA